MWLIDWLIKGRGHGIDELARRLSVREKELSRIRPDYREFTIPKRSGGRRQILAPSEELMKLQRRIHRRLLARLAAHPAAMGFERGRSIVTNARAHQGQTVVLRYDLVNFFNATSAGRLKRYFRSIGWNRPATRFLLMCCTHKGGLPQGAPTSPRLSNLVNYRLDARLAGFAARLGGAYTRYADDITISLSRLDFDQSSVSDRHRRPGQSSEQVDGHGTADQIARIGRFVRKVAAEEGYRVHRRKKLSVRRRHQCQIVTGLVVNERVNLPRTTRRWLRAVEHRTRMAEDRSLASYKPFSGHTRKSPTLTPAQLQGWRALRDMVQRPNDAE